MWVHGVGDGAQFAPQAIVRTKCTHANETGRGYGLSVARQAMTDACVMRVVRLVGRAPSSEELEGTSLACINIYVAAAEPVAGEYKTRTPVCVRCIVLLRLSQDRRFHKERSAQHQRVLHRTHAGLVRQQRRYAQLLLECFYVSQRARHSMMACG